VTTLQSSADSAEVVLPRGRHSTTFWIPGPRGPRSALDQSGDDSYDNWVLAGWAGFGAEVRQATAK
jgi:hypothetical protein